MDSTVALPVQSLALPIQLEASPAQTEPSRLRRAVGVIAGIVFSTGLGAGLNYFMCRNHPNMFLGVLIGAVQGFTDATVGAIVDHWVENKKHAQIIKSVSTFVIATISIVGLTTLGMLTPTWAIVSGVFAAVILAWGLYSAFQLSSTEKAAQEPKNAIPALVLEEVDESDSNVGADDHLLNPNLLPTSRLSTTDEQINSLSS